MCFSRGASHGGVTAAGRRAGLWLGGQTHGIPGAIPGLARGGRPAVPPSLPFALLPSASAWEPHGGADPPAQWNKGLADGVWGDAQRGMKSGGCAPCFPQNRSVPLAAGFGTSATAVGKEMVHVLRTCHLRVRNKVWKTKVTLSHFLCKCRNADFSKKSLWVDSQHCGGLLTS